jgi:hypothetical protein
MNSAKFKNYSIFNSGVPVRKTGDVNFDSKIQVFFPYIKGSVEVNQVIQLLQNLNKFIEAFNDITHTHQYESTTKADQKWEESDISPQITNKLESKYDVYRFEVE